jgi:predicted kinase
MVYGFPGSGKTYFGRQICEHIQAAHLQADRIRFELFENPRYDKQENEVVAHLMDYMTEEFLQAGVSVVYDADVSRLAQRRVLRDTARRLKADHLLIWLQIDADSAFARINRRDKRRSDDKYAVEYERNAFENVINAMQNPKEEDYIVISGKHTFITQRSAIMKKLYELKLVTSDGATSKVVKPNLVNLVPNLAAGRVDISRRNIVIR